MALFEELKRRNVIRVAVAYAVMGWLLVEIATTLLPTFHAPDWVAQVIILVIALGFIPTLVFSWVFELTPDGLKRESEIDRDASITHQTARRLDVITIVAVVLGVAFVAFLRTSPEPTPAAPDTPSDAPNQAQAQAQPPEQAPATDQSIAVLPFVNMSDESENEYFADGLSEEILNRLAQVPDLRVIARTSSFAFKGQNRDLREVGQLLDVANVLEGSVRRQGDQVRVTAQLIAAHDGSHLWSQTYDRQMDDVFAIQDEIAEQVAVAMDILLDEEARQRMRDAGIRNVEAFVAYQQGDQALVDAHGQPNQADLLLAANIHFDRAIELAPQFAAAYLGKADYYAHEVFDADQSLEHRRAALATYDEILAAGSKQARDPLRRALIEFDRIIFSDDWRSLDEVLEDLFQATGCVTGNWLEILQPFGHDDEALDYWRRILRCNPLHTFAYLAAASYLLDAGDLAAARALLEQGRARVGDHNWIRAAERTLMIADGDLESSLERLDDWYEAGILQTRRTHLRLLAAHGRREQAEAIVQELEANPETGPAILLEAYAVLGQRQRANELAAAIDASPGGVVSLIRLVNNCSCGNVFDLEATPNLGARVEESGLTWQPARIAEFPLKDW